MMPAIPIPGRLVQIEFKEDGTMWVVREIAGGTGSDANTVDSMYLERDTYDPSKHWVVTVRATAGAVIRQAVSTDEIRVFGFLEGELNGDDADPKG
jgi:hypothetical protein